MALVQVRYGCAGGTAWGNTRFESFYEAPGTPDAFFDGVTECQGSLANVGEQFTWYENAYAARQMLPADITIDVTGYLLTEHTYRIGAQLCLEPGATDRTVRVYVVQVLDDWPDQPDYMRNGFKSAAETADVALAPGQCELVFAEITLDDDSWTRQNDVRIITWAQEPQDTSPPLDRAEVFQAATTFWPPPPDCNANGIVDWQDIATGTSDDLNTNGIPDECEFASAGIHLWTTPNNGLTSHNFAVQPIPPDFFDPGSDPFTGEVTLGGEPLFTMPPAGLGSADTVVERLQDADVMTVPSQDTVDIQIRAINLFSIVPITITYNGGQDPEFWGVRMCLSDLPQPVGTMTVYRHCQDGGTYDAVLPVLPKFIFTSQRTRAQRYLDYGVLGLPPLEFTVGGAPWVGNADPSLSITEAASGVSVDSNCDGSWETTLVGTTAYVPGIWSLPCEPLTPPGAGEQRKRVVLLTATGATLGVIAAQSGSDDTDGDGIVDDADNCPSDSNPLQQDNDEDTVGNPCDNCPDHYNPFQEDCDSDGLGDVCALATGVSEDCNYNDVPDNCDITAGTSLDVDSNGIPDECQICRGDCNCDDCVSWRDIDYLVAGLISEQAWLDMFLPGTPSCYYASCDVNMDRSVTWRDIDPFIAVMNTTCPEW